MKEPKMIQGFDEDGYQYITFKSKEPFVEKLYYSAPKIFKALEFIIQEYKTKKCVEEDEICYTASHGHCKVREIKKLVTDISLQMKRKYSIEKKFWSYWFRERPLCWTSYIQKEPCPVCDSQIEFMFDQAWQGSIGKCKACNSRWFVGPSKPEFGKSKVISRIPILEDNEEEIRGEEEL